MNTNKIRGMVLPVLLGWIVAFGINIAAGATLIDAVALSLLLIVGSIFSALIGIGLGLL